MPHRLDPSDLEQLGTYLFGPRWQTALAHAVHRDPRLVRRWLAGGRKVTRHSAMLVEAMVRETYAKRMRRPNADFLLMVAGLGNAALRGRLLLDNHFEKNAVDDQLRRAAIVTPPAFVVPVPVAVPVVDFAPHNVPACLSCPMYQHLAAKMSGKSRPVAPVAINGATPVSAPASVPAGSVRRSTPCPS